MESQFHKIMLPWHPMPAGRQGGGVAGVPAVATSRKPVISVIALHGRTTANGDHPRGLRAAGMWPASAKTSPAVIGSHGVPAVTWDL